MVSVRASTALSFLLRILRAVRRGKVSLEIEGRRALSMEFGESSLVLELEDLEPLRATKSALPPTSRGSPTSGLSRIREIADLLKEEDYTISVVWRKRTVVVIGRGARPGISRIFLGTDSVEVRSMRDALDLLSQLM